MNMEHQWNDNDRKAEVLREKSVPVPLRPPQIPHGLLWEQTQASTVKSQQLTMRYGTAKVLISHQAIFYYLFSV
jgi:hypothetical protein